MRKYILLLITLLSIGTSSAQYNLFARQNFSHKGILTPNTFIGGVSATISTPTLLATILAIDVSRISNFSVVGSDIQCRITGSYAILSAAFEARTDITNFYDYDGLVTSIASQTFNLCPNINFLWFPNCLSVGNSASLGLIGVYTTIYLPRCVSMGTTSASNAVFGGTNHQAKLYCPILLQTNNGGAPDGDIADFISLGGTVSYISNFTPPNSISDLSTGTIYNTAIQLNFTPPSSTNAIDFYECYVNGVFNNKFTGNVGYAIGLTASTSYNLTVYAVDIFYNKSAVSNTLTQSTDNYSYTDTDANASISAKSLAGKEAESEYLLITGLKTNSLYVKTQAIYTFKGNTASQHKFNSKNPIDTNGAFRLTFTGAATFSNDGYQLNGSSYANTYFTPSANQTINSNGITVVIGTNNAANSSDTYEVGAINGSQYSFITSKRNNTDYGVRARMNNGLLERTGVNESRGVLTAVRQNSTDSKLIKNNTTIATDTGGGGSLPTINQFIGGVNLNGSVYGNSNQRIQIVIFHEGLSDTEVATLHSIIDLSETIAGRKTW